MKLAARTALAESLLADDAVAAQVGRAFFSRHPEWKARFGTAGQQRCVEDTRFHISYLAAAVQAGAPVIFADYATWCGEMLAARKIERSHLLEHLELLQEHLYRRDADGPGDRHELLDTTFELAREALSVETIPDASREEEHTPLQLSYISNALAGDRKGAWGLIHQFIEDGVSVADIYVDVLLWAQRRLGALWATTDITVAHEHMASAVTQSVIARLYAHIPGQRSRGRVLIAGVEGEQHSLPAQFAADLLELNGWDVVFLGTNMPSHDVLDMIDSERPDVVGLSITMPIHLTRTVELARQIRERYTSLPVVIGGRAAPPASALADELDVSIAGDIGIFESFG
ncbi:MAG: cobalamin B12-binding domain-containing protein [Myxococcota bacterium]